MAEQATGCPFERAEDISFMDPRVQEHWFEAYAVLRAQAPVHYMPETGMYVLTRYADIEHVVRQPRLFTVGPDVQSAEPLVKFPEARALYEHKGWRRYTPLGENLPKHKAYRRLVDPVFTPTALRRYEPFIRATIDELIDGWIDQGEIEFIRAFAEPLPMRVIAELLGFPRMDLSQLKEWSQAWVLPFSRGLTREQELWAVEEHIELQHYIHQTMEAKRRAPKDDIMTRLVQAEFEDPTSGETRPLTDTEIIGITDHLLIGGNETTTFALSNGLWLLFRHPAIHASLQAEPGRVKTFVEEVLRIESPTQGLYRFVTEDVEIGGVEIPEGAILNLRYGAGNHDPARFPDPREPDLERKNAARHMAFSLGEHHCPGASLSRLEQTCAWEILLRRLRHMSPAPEKNTYQHLPGIWLRALKEIHMQFDSAG